MKLFERLSVKGKLFLFVITVYAISVLAAVVYAVILFTNSSYKVSENTAVLINNNYASQAVSEIEKGILLIETLSESTMITSRENKLYIPEQQISAFSKLIYDNSSVTDMFIILNKSLSRNFSADSLNDFELFLHRTKVGIDQSLFDRRNFNLDLSDLHSTEEERRVFVSDPFWLKYSDQSTFVITIYSPLILHEKIVGMIGVNYSLEGISEIINRQFADIENVKTMILSDNLIVAVTNKELLSGKNILSTEGEEHTLYNNILSDNYNFSGYDNKSGAYKKVRSEFGYFEWEIITTLPSDQTVKKFTYNIYVSVLIVLLIMFIGLIGIILFVRRSFAPFNTIINATEEISTGKPVDIISYDSENEFGRIIKNINSISEILKKASTVSSEIAEGNYKKRLEVNSSEDILSKSINKIAVNMENSFEENKKQEENTNRQLWTRRGRFEVAEAERKSKNDINDISFNIIRTLVNYTNAALGGIYLYDDELDTVRLTAAYAYGNQKQLNAEYKPGEGLAGACLIEKKKILLDKIPDDYVKISSGLGSGIPRFLILIPVFFQEKINSIIEIAFISQPEAHIIEFIELLSDNIGAWIDASITSTKTSKLLEISKDQTKELALKEQELNVKVEEMQKVQSEIAVQNAEYESMLNAVNNTVMTVEYTLEGIILNSNRIYEDIMGFNLDDIKGINVLDLVKDQHSDLKKIIDEVGKGTPVKRQVKRYTKSGDEKWLSATYTPYYDKDSKITRVLFFAFDITQMKHELDQFRSKK